ncbi:hypothetical protein ABZ470_29435 [Streptosporangium sp. NPDC020072]|uniref:hypothetical protein n=1 Tax=Streptosporangium sp. NPDC020072 TaxID=3154788 RepID=UPI00342020FF
MDISTTIARRSFTGSLAERVILCRRRFSIVNARTNTSGLRATATSQNSSGTRLACSPAEIK